jgi:hypothetical protein
MKSPWEPTDYMAIARRVRARLEREGKITPLSSQPPSFAHFAFFATREIFASSSSPRIIFLYYQYFLFGREESERTHTSRWPEGRRPPRLDPRHGRVTRLPPPAPRWRRVPCRWRTCLADVPRQPAGRRRPDRPRGQDTAEAGGRAVRAARKTFDSPAGLPDRMAADVRREPAHDG